jgi:hypothetical protein
MSKTAHVSMSVPSTASTRALGCSISTRTSAWTAAPASRSARWRPFITRTTCRKSFKDDNAAFFFETLPGQDEPLGSPGGAAKLGVIDADTPLVAGLPPQASED